MTATKMTYLRNDKGEFVCPDCGVTKARQNTMFYHMKKHTGELNHVCMVCDKGFIQKSGLQQHMIQAHPTEGCAPAWECPLCPHTCRMKSNMLIHIGRKHGDGWIPCIGAEGGACTGCKKEFASATAYYYHAVQCFPAPTNMTDALATFGATISAA